MDNLNALGENWKISPNHRDGKCSGSKWDYVALLSLMAVPFVKFVIQKWTSKEVREWETGARILIKDYENSLVQRQRIFCSPFEPKEQRIQLERKMLDQAAANPIAKELDIENDLRYIFCNETHCADTLNKDPRKNGKIMWDYLKKWEIKVEEKKYKLIEEARSGKK